jgi:hypothetical protein
MAELSSTFDTYNAKGIRENLSDIIYRISPEETPFISNIGKEDLQNTYFEWQNDSLASAATNSALEGDDIASFPSVTATQRLGNYAQISRKLVLVSGTLDTVKKAGRKSELAYQTSLRAAELKRDMEFIATQNQAAVAGNSTTARLTAGLESFLRTNTSVGATGSNATLSGTTQGYPSTARTDGTQRAFSETILKSVMAAVYTSGGKPSYLMVGVTQKQNVSAFAGIAVNRFQITKPEMGAVIGAVDVYVSDYGNLQIVPNRFQRNRTAFFIQPEYCSVGFLRPFTMETLAKTGDAEKRLLLCEWGLKVKHEAAHGAAYDLT